MGKSRGILRYQEKETGLKSLTTLFIERQDVRRKMKSVKLKDVSFLSEKR